MRYSSQLGQSIVEFCIAIVALLAFLIGIPIVAKIANVNVMSVQALDYAAWRVREGNTDSAKLSSEVSDRYFGETALIVDDEKIIHSGVHLGVGRENERIYQYDNVLVSFDDDVKANNNYPILKNNYRLPVDDKKGVVSISVPLENLDVLPEIPSSLTIKKSLYVENQALTALDERYTQERISNMSSNIVPYNNNKGQKQINKHANELIDALKFATLGFVDEHKISTVQINDAAVPRDRLAVYQP